MHTGTIVRVVESRGFGFIGATGQPDCFFHVKDTVGLEWGEQLVGLRVTFNIVGTDKGSKAVAVQAAE